MKDTLPDRVRFGEFELDLRSGELRHGGSGVFLQDQPFKVLRMLVEGDGRIVGREEIRKKLWPNDTVVEFDHSINVAIGNLRRALGDSAEKPNFIQTIARRGYRFMVPVEWVPEADDSAEPVSRLDGDGATVSRRRPESGGLTGRAVSHYRVLDIIGGGGMGVVYRAEDLKLGRQVALKFLPEEMGSDPQALERFSREARAASSLDHPNICHIYEFGEHEGQPFIVMQLLEGRTLRDRLAAVAEGERLPLDELLDIGIQVSDGLQAAHERGIIHRDIKPANIFLTSNGKCKMLDFGLAKLLESADEEETAAGTEKPPPASASNASATHLTRTGTAIGTAGYMSPEQVRGEKLDTRTDLFSFGLVLYEMATGRRAFAGETAAIVREAIVNSTPAPACEFNREISPDLQAIIHKALEKDRERRFQTADDLGRELRHLQSDAGNGKHHWPLLVVASVVMLMVGIGVAGLLWRRGRLREDLQERQITANPQGDRVTGAAVSPDGKYLAFADQTGLYLRSIESGETHPITLPAELRGRIFGLRWFPEGGKLVAGVNGSDGEDIWVIGAPGQEKPYLLYRHGFEPAISPDSRMIAFTNGELAKDKRQVWVGAIDGSQRRKLADTGELECVSSPVWSPDGHWIAYGRSWKTPQGAWISAIEVRPAAGGPARTLVAESSLPKSYTFIQGTDAQFAESWSPDWHLVFSVTETSESPTKYSLWQVRVDPRAVETVDKPERLMEWSRFWPWNLTITADGRRLSLLKERSWVDVYVAELGAGGTTMKTPHRLTRDDRGNNLGTWEPDSQAILFDSERNGRREIFRQALNENVPENIITGAGDLSSVTLSPDGSLFLYQESEVASVEDTAPYDSVWLMRRLVGGGEPARLLKMMWADDSFCSSNAKSHIPCVLGQTEGKNLVFYSLNPVTGRGRRLGKIEIVSPWWQRGWNVSPDGSHLAFVDRQKYGGRIEVLTLADGEWHEVSAQVGEQTLYQVAFAADGKSFFVTSRASHSFNLLHVTPAGKAHRLLTIEGNQNGLLQLPLPSRDGRYLAFSSQTWDSNVWMIDKF